MSEPQSRSPGTLASKKPETKPAATGASVARAWSVAQFPLAIFITVVVLAYLLWPERPPTEETQVAPEAEIVKLIGQQRLSIVAGTPLEKKLVIAPVVEQETTAAKLKVFGAIVARSLSGKEKAEEVKQASPRPGVPGTPPLPSTGEGRNAPSFPAADVKGDGSLAEAVWDFNTPDLASAYSDWLKARHDVPFYQKQFEDIQKLSEETLKAKREVRDRLEKLVAVGTDPVKDLAAAAADYRQAVIQANKDEHEAQTNLDNAKRTLSTLERQLFQAGMDPELLANPIKNLVIVAAEVPEARISLVKPGQDCVAQFSAVPGHPFPGTVRSLSPTISKERRTLRVFFQLDDPQGRLRPGMFAEIGLGTDLRKVLRMSADGVLHVGQSDYVLVETNKDDWKITQITTGEQYGSQIEVLDGLRAGDRVIGYGAILLKPYVVQDVQATADAAAAAISGGSGGR